MYIQHVIVIKVIIGYDSISVLHAISIIIIIILLPY